MTDEQTERYFDWAATSPADKMILREALEETLFAWGNPSSVHSAGKEARELLEEARNRSAKALGVKPEQLFFTSGGTESDHIPLLSVINRPQKGHVLFSSIEPPAVREQALALKKCGFTVDSIPSDKNGIITPEAVCEKLTTETLFVSIMAVNNETGAIQPIYDIADAIAGSSRGKRRPRLHIDCVQAAGKIPLELNHKGIDSAAFSSHKICGPRGIGLLYLAEPNSFEPFLRGGGQEKGVRSGTENVFGAVAFSKCLQKYCISESNEGALERYKAQLPLTERFVSALTCIKGCTLIPAARTEKPECYSPWVVQAAFEKIPGQVMLRALDAEGFCISTGSACSARKNNRPVLDAMNISPKESENAVRFSFGPATTEEGMQELLSAVQTIASRFNSAN